MKTKLSRKERKQQKDKKVKALVKEYLLIFTIGVDSGLSPTEIRDKLRDKYTDDITTDPQNKHIHNEAVRVFHDMIERGVQRVKEEKEALNE